MNDFTSIFFTILVCLLSTVHLTFPSAQEDSSKGPGISACRWFGFLPSACNESVPVEKAPKECTSFIYEGVRIDLDNKIYDYVDKNSGFEQGLIEQILATGKKVFLQFGHDGYDEWTRILDVNPDYIKTVAQNEMQSLKAYVDQHKGIKGLIITHLEVQDLVNLTGNIKQYMDVMKSTFPDMEIGMRFDCDTVAYFIQYFPNLKWFDFNILNSVIEFYIINLYDINKCTDEFVKTGVLPLTGNSSIDTSNNTNTIITIQTFRDFLEGAGIPLDKLYYNLPPFGTLSDPNGDICSIYYQNICNEKIKSDNNGLCADTQQSLFEKGEYVGSNGAGFIISIDLDVADDSCECGRPFPAFYALLDGFHGKSPPPACPLFDRS